MATAQHEPLHLSADVSVSLATGLDLLTARRLQAGVYVEEGFVDDVGHDRTIDDPYVAHADYFLARRSDEVVGTVRLIHWTERHGLPTLQLPMWADWQDHLGDVPLEQSAEVSALAVAPSARSSIGASEALYRAMFARALERGVGALFACSEARLFRNLKRRFGAEFVPLGDPVNYLGGDVVPSVLLVEDFVCLHLAA